MKTTNKDLVYVSSFLTYGNAYKIRLNKKTMKGVFIFLCIVTPFTNWLIVFINKLITKDLLFIIRK